MEDRLQEEYKRLRERASNCHPRDMTGYFMAQQAIAWVIDPTMAMAPSELMRGGSHTTIVSTPPASNSD